MKLYRPYSLLAFTLFVSLLPALAQRSQRDPLNAKEVNELRETNQEPEKRLPLIVRFARERLDAALAARNNPKLASAERTATIHDSVQDFVSIYDELGDNLDMYTDQKEDLRKPLKIVIAGDGEFKVKLEQLRRGASPDEMKTYGFALTSALEAVNDGTGEHRRLQQEQEESAKARKKAHR
ncbi:MAG TPA: hypothetical protein VL177_05810 [Terriglobales bacterium]|jgi:hypothetical protein|nr:hypothetical protein [Terriglobales bacterium]